MLARGASDFRNLYGQGVLGPAQGARKRGAWDGTKGFIDRAATCWSTRSRSWASAAAAAREFRDRVESGRSCPSRLARGRTIWWSTPDESEPGTCKDREVMWHDPHRQIEGCLYRRLSAMGRLPGLHLYPRRIRA